MMDMTGEGGRGLGDLREAASKGLLALLWMHVPFNLGVALLLGHDWLLPGLMAVGLAGATTLSWRMAGSTLSTRLLVAVALMGMISLLLAQMAGHPWQVDVHMYYFAGLALLAAYCDWRVLLMAAIGIALHHLGLNFLLPMAVYPGGSDLRRVVLHAVIVLLETGVLVCLTAELARLFERAAEKEAELRDAHRVARIGTWRRDLVEGTLTMSEEMHGLLGIDLQTFEPTPENLLALVHPDDREAMAAARARGAAGEGTVGREWCVLRADGTLAWFWAETRVEVDATDRTVAVHGVCQDVTERHAAAERIYKLAHHDALTGLANRALLHERLSDAVARARRIRGTLAVLCLDLDGFKAVNDLNGHAAGDCLLREVAARLGRNVRETDTVARLGGDEFVVLQDVHAQPAAGRSLADRLVAALAEPYDLGVGTYGGVTASVGVALFPGDGSDPETLLHNADIALYRAKAAGKNGSAFFQPGMDRELRDRRAMERDLRQAAARGELGLPRLGGRLRGLG